MERRLAAWLVADRLQRVHACQVRILEVRQPAWISRSPETGRITRTSARAVAALGSLNPTRSPKRRSVPTTRSRSDSLTRCRLARRSRRSKSNTRTTLRRRDQWHTATSTLADLLRQSENGRVTTAFVHDSWRPLSRLLGRPPHASSDTTSPMPRFRAAHHG